MHFFRDSASAPCSQKRQERFWAALLLEEQKPRMVFVQSSCITHTLRFSALASCVTLSPASLQSSARVFLHLCTRMYSMPVFQEQKPATKKLLFLEVPIKYVTAMYIR